MSVWVLLVYLSYTHQTTVKPVSVHPSVAECDTAAKVELQNRHRVMSSGVLVECVETPAKGLKP